MYCALQVCILLLYKRTAWSQLSFNYFFNIRKTFNKKERQKPCTREIYNLTKIIKIKITKEFNLLKVPVTTPQ